MCAMSCVMRRCSHLEQVRLVKCELNAELLKNFEFNLKGSIVKVSEFDISLNPMSVEAFDIFGSVLTNIEVEKLVMRGCSLTEEKLRVLGRNSHLQIHILDVRNITNMTFDLYLAIVKFASEHAVNKLLMDPWDCFIASNKQLLELSKWEVCGKIQVLDVRNITNMTFDLYLAIAKIASKHDVKELLIDPWDCFKASEEQLLELSKWKVCGKINVLDVQSITQMSSDLCLTIYEFASQRGVKKILMDSLDFSKANKEQLKKLSKYKLCGKISVIDISQNSMDEEAFDVLGDLFTNYEVDQLIAKNCQLTKAKLDALGSHSGLEICSLDIRSITHVTFDLFLAISKFASESEVKELLMDPWKELKANKDQIMELSKWKVYGKLDKLDVSNNKDLGTAGFGKVGTVVSKCQVKELKAQGCNLTAEGMKAFKENTRNAKLNELDVSYNRNLRTDGFGELGLVVTQCHVESFNATGCDLTAEGIKAFKENTRNAKIKYLILSFNPVSKLGDEELFTICEIVHQCQVEKLDMEYCHFINDQLERFKALIADTGVEFFLKVGDCYFILQEDRGESSSLSIQANADSDSSNGSFDGSETPDDLEKSNA
uniref:uncharacterized protein LOC120331517 n=1 Tax=Styela clava TaxID=7725 RepID=UPI00193953B8|nr:uncharacterized protein LOC120331517 [Styela clava]